MRLSAMGDVAMTVPVLRALVAQYPNVRVTMISRPFYQPFFAGIPNIEFFAFQAKGRHQGFFGLWRLYRDLKPLKIDAFADLHDVLRSKVVRKLFALAGKKVAFTDKGRAEKKALTRAENKIFKPLKTMFQRHADTFQKLGFPINLSKPEFPVKPKLDPAVLDFTGEKTKPWIGIAPFAQYESKVYPPDLMQEVIQELAKENQYEVFLFGAASEKHKLEFLAQDSAVRIVTGKLAFEQELQLISHLDLMLSMDSGNGHIAAMYGVKVVTLFGATHPYAGFQPFNQPLENALMPDLEQFPKLPTSVYGNKIVAGYEDAMRTILPEKVIEKIREVL
ncbi:glycosyltransferase family 9 protein [Flavobacterium sp. CYK-4]|uniref:glycosyltransferase family 9 protein n=1 Tax=Flavobacterium lotistagni TaxID=2709660 RepID=UPI00140CECA4|nr:glycosyltransferase family 9 protein [Flavobacterium lotistagni]NHM07796.1 glycosyltransferase family 9 protein [Flavobacterium lotistagni]